MQSSNHNFLSVLVLCTPTWTSLSFSVECKLWKSIIANFCLRSKRLSPPSAESHMRPGFLPHSWVRINIK
jgi:hypothetical protein